jgi:hypothetical protein
MISKLTSEYLNFHVFYHCISQSVETKNTDHYGYWLKLMSYDLLLLEG